MTPAEILRAARAKIENPEHWTQGHWARSAQNNSIGYDAPGAVCWCAGGAILCVAEGGTDVYGAMNLLSAVAGHVCVFKYNDTHTHTEVLKAFDEAIALADARTPV